MDAAGLEPRRRLAAFAVVSFKSSAVDFLLTSVRRREVDNAGSRSTVERIVLSGVRRPRSRV
jgi:hypothetical protein